MIDFTSAALTTGDLEVRWIHGTVNARNLVAVASLAENGSAGRVHTIVRSDAFAFPTMVAVGGDRLLVVNGQLDNMGGHPRLPFRAVLVLEAASPETPRL